MLIDNKDKSLLPRFVPAKTIDFGRQAEMRRKYRRNFEVASIISLIITIILTRWTPNWKIMEKYKEVEVDAFEVIDVPLIEEEFIPPPPPLPPPDVAVEDILVADEIEVMSEKKKEEEEPPKLDLELDIEDNRILESQLEDDFRTKVDNYRKWKLSSSRLSIGDNYRSRSLANSGLNIGLAKNDDHRREHTASSRLDIKLDTRTDGILQAEKEATVTSSSVIEMTESEDVVVLKPPKSSLALTEYRMWTKLSGEFDRIDKRSLPREIPNLKKDRNGIQISFRYRDGIMHQIIWKKGGKTSIKVIGKNRKSSLEELKRALSALLQLTLNNY